MLAFVTSLRHPANATDYGRIEVLLQETLGSISQQSSDDYVIIIVGNREPSFDLPERAVFVPVDFPPPAAATGPHADRDGFVRDKGTKIGVGLLEARKYDPSHVMIFDADDFVHRDLAAFVGRHPREAGWVIDRGWIYSRARNGYRAQDSFNRTCGTSYIVAYDAYAVPALPVTATQQQILDGYGDVLPNIMGAHRNAVQWHRERGRVLQRLPFRGAVYHVDTGENHSGKQLSGLLRPWRRHLERTFAIPASRGRVSSLWACLGPQALAQSVASLAGRLAARIRRLAPARSRQS